MDLNTSISKLFMVGPTYVRRLSRSTLLTLGDLLYHFPFRYDDFSVISPINRVQPGQIVTIQGRIMEMKNVYTKYGKKIQKALVGDLNKTIQVIWFNQPFLIKTLRPGLLLNLSGKVSWFDRKIALVSPEYEIIKEQTTNNIEQRSIHTGRLVPVYHETYGVSSKWLRSRIWPLIEKIITDIEDFLPLEIRQANNLMELKSALRQVHFPQNLPEAELARRRFAFEELFLIQLKTILRKKFWQKKKSAFQFQIDAERLLEFVRNLPFELTSAQKKVIREILADLSQKKPMNRLLEGDVGSGKTVVAAAAIHQAYLNGVQSALMAPTEILAQQHYLTLNQILTPLGVKIELLTGSKKPRVKKDQGSKTDLIIGTHALIYKRAQFEKLGLSIIDEQHRFGVEQRSQLIHKGKAPHILTMTATPIPRTIALTLYGDLDLSVIDEMPPGRQKIKTWVVPPVKRSAAYDWIRKKIKGNDNQAFIICPLIEESSAETFQSVKAVSSEFERLKKEVFPDLRLGLLHGRLTSKQKNEIMEKFKKGRLDILVSTPVVEVGIDIPAATIILIEAAERFGLAQLHQLRGRVGRGSQTSYCLLFTNFNGGKTFIRLKSLERIDNGMKLAELDLKFRGPGDVYGTAQHGFYDLKIASFNDLDLIENTKRIAQKILIQDPDLNHHFPLKEKLKQDKIKSIEPN